MRKYVTEFIGTFFLVLTVTCAVGLNAPLAPLGIGAALMVMVFAGGHISGGHYNPAVTLAVMLRGKIAMSDALPYWGAQMVAGVVGALFGRWLVPGVAKAAAAPTGERLLAAGVAEILFTFALAYVVLNVATSKDHPNNSFYGLAIGFTVAAGAVAVGPISGGAFNPAVALGVSVAGLAGWSVVWLVIIANLIGGAIAAYTFRYLNPADLA